MKRSLFLVFLMIAGCSSSSENMRVIKGYSEEQYKSIEKKIVGKTPKYVKQIFGEPIIEGKLSERSYRMIYPAKDMKRFYIEITYNTDAELDCAVIDFFKPKRGQVFTFPRNGKVKKLLRCNQKDGVILKLQEALEAK